jgi:hypothetical protein
VELEELNARLREAAAARDELAAAQLAAQDARIAALAAQVRELRRRLQTPGHQGQGDTLPGPPAVQHLEWYARQVTEQRWRLVRNVAVAEPEIFNLIDRYFAEADFIRELIFPLSALGLVIAIRFSLAGIILIVLSLALMQIVDRPLVEGYGYLYAAISAGKLDFGELTEWTSGMLRLKQVVK